MKRWPILALTLFIPALVWATTVVPMDVEQLSRFSTHIVEARAVDSVSQWNSDHTFIFTYTRFETIRTLKGEVPGTFMVRQIGGTMDGVSQKVAGVRQWRSGEEAVLFLQPSTLADGALVVTGLMQGNFLMRHTARGQTFVSNGMPEVSEYRASNGEAASYQGSQLRLKDLETRIQMAVQK